MKVGYNVSLFLFLTLLIQLIPANSAKIEIQDFNTTNDPESVIWVDNLPSSINDMFFTNSTLDLKKIDQAYYGDTLSFVVRFSDVIFKPDVAAKWNFENTWPQKPSPGSPMRSEDNTYSYVDIIPSAGFDYFGEGVLQIDHLNVTDEAGTTIMVTSADFEFPSVLLMNESRKGKIQPQIAYDQNLRNGASLKMNLNSTLHFGADLSLSEIYIGAEIRNRTHVLVAGINNRTVAIVDDASNYLWDTKITDEGEYTLFYNVTDDLSRIWAIEKLIMLTSVTEPAETEVVSTSTQSSITSNTLENVTTNDTSVPIPIKSFLISLLIFGIRWKRKTEIQILKQQT